MPIPVVNSWAGQQRGYAAKNFHTTIRSYRFPYFRMEPYFEGDRYVIGNRYTFDGRRYEYIPTNAPFPVIANCARKSIVRIRDANTND